jgi:4'-phosphopantetheinyl transferase
MIGPTLAWSPPPAELDLGPAEVHVWRAWLDRPAEDALRMQALLSVDERARADRFLFARHRHHFVVARGVLRVLLGRYLHRAPEQLRFQYNRYGKPEIAGPDGSTLRFNLARSHGLALYAVNLGTEIGIDVERVRTNLEYDQMAQRFFAGREVAELRRLPHALRVEGFFHAWTRKEAYIKARGVGLAIPLGRFAVSLSPGRPAALLETEDPAIDPASWMLLALAPADGYAAALAVASHCTRVAGWELTGAPGHWW